MPRDPFTRPPSIDPDAFTFRTCEKCQQLHAVPKRSRRRPCTSCRLFAAHARASARSRVLLESAERAYVAERRLVHDVEDARIARNQLAYAGGCEDRAPWLVNLPCFPALSYVSAGAASTCEHLPPHKLRVHRRAAPALQQLAAAHRDREGRWDTVPPVRINVATSTGVEDCGGAL